MQQKINCKKKNWIARKNRIERKNKELREKIKKGGDRIARYKVRIVKGGIELRDIKSELWGGK